MSNSPNDTIGNFYNSMAAINAANSSTSSTPEKVYTPVLEKFGKYYYFRTKDWAAKGHFEDCEGHYFWRIPENCVTDIQRENNGRCDIYTFKPTEWPPQHLGVSRLMEERWYWIYNRGQESGG